MAPARAPPCVRASRRPRARGRLPRAEALPTCAGDGAHADRNGRMTARSDPPAPAAPDDVAKVVGAIERAASELAEDQADDAAARALAQAIVVHAGHGRAKVRQAV